MVLEIPSPLRIIMTIVILLYVQLLHKYLHSCLPTKRKLFIDKTCIFLMLFCVLVCLLHTCPTSRFIAGSTVTGIHQRLVYNKIWEKLWPILPMGLVLNRQILTKKVRISTHLLFSLSQSLSLLYVCMCISVWRWSVWYV